MMKNSYSVDSKMIPPIILAMISGTLLVIMEWSTTRGFLLIILLAPFFYLAAEILARKINIGSDGLIIRKLLRKKELKWSEIESLDAIRTGNKVFLILVHSGGRPILISNAIRRFHALAEALMERLSPDLVAPGVREYIQNQRPKYGPIIQAWLVCIVLSTLLAAKFMGFSS